MSEWDEYYQNNPSAWGGDETQVLPGFVGSHASGDGHLAANAKNIVRDAYSVWNTQVGGSHYKDMAIQPTEYIVKNGLNFVEGNIIKYVTRYRYKGGLQDLEKARHYLDILIEMERDNLNGR